MGCRSSTWTPQSSVDGVYFKRPTLNLIGRATRLFNILAQFEFQDFDALKVFLGALCVLCG